MTRKVHRLVADGHRVACGARVLLAVRWRAHLVAFMSRHPDARPCRHCWPSEPAPVPEPAPEDAQP